MEGHQWAPLAWCRGAWGPEEGKGLVLFEGFPDQVKPKEVGGGTTGGTSVGVPSVGAPGEVTVL